MAKDEPQGTVPFAFVSRFADPAYWSSLWHRPPEQELPEFQSAGPLRSVFGRLAVL